MSFIINGQVAINSSSPSTAAALQIDAQKLPTTNFGGFLMPIVTEAQQALIPVSTIDTSDDGLMVFVSDPGTGKQCWEIFDAVQQVWRSIFCLDEKVCNAVLYSENFESYAEDSGITGASATNGDYPASVTKWTLSSYSDSPRDGSTSLPGSLVNADDYALVKSGELEMHDTNGPLLFQTESIDITGYSSITISCEIFETGLLEYLPASHTDDFNCGDDTNGSDYVDMEYSTDGGATYTEVPNFMGLGNSDHTLSDNLSGRVFFSVTGITGTSLIFRIRFQNWANDEYFFLDNIQVKCD